MLLHKVLAKGQKGYAFTYQLVSSLLLFGLVYEVLSPWYRSTDWGTVFVPQLLAYSALAVLLFGTIVRTWLWRWLGYTIVIIVSLYICFTEAHQSITSRLIQLPTMLRDSFVLLWANGLFQMDDFLRISLLLIGWSILVIALQQLNWQYYMASSFLFVSVAYLLMLHVFFGLNIYEGLLKIVFYGTLLTALTFYMKRKSLFKMVVVAPNQQRNTANNMQTSKVALVKPLSSVYYTISLVLVTTVLIGMTYLLTDQKDKNVEIANWSKAFTQRFINDMSVFSTEVKGQPILHQTTYRAHLKSGYGVDDSQLGTSANIQEKAVFHAWSPQPVYWRGEAKSEYTGSGWTDAERLLSIQQLKEEAEVISAWSLQYGLKSSIIKQEITWLEPTSQRPLFHGGVKSTVLTLEATNPSRELTNYIEDELTHNVYAPTDRAVISGYKVMAELPIMDEDVLKEIEPLENELAEYIWQRDSLEQNLKLPEQLPLRVKALANEIASGGLTSRYDQVKAVESYLKSNYEYSLQSEVPKAGEDFVDHFLFEQRAGYCVHFASSMVALLRSQNIPARYVKGYTQGKIIDERINEDGYMEHLYEVGEQDAHAWVEVYFPGAGWVPFDPTPANEDRAEAGMLSKLQEKLTELKIDEQLVKLQTFVQANASYFLFVTMAIVILGVVTVILALFKRSKLYVVLHYARAYKQTLGIIEHLAAIKYTQHNLSRTSEYKLLRTQLQQRQQKKFTRLTQTLDVFLENEVVKLERKQKIKYNDTFTMRKRIERLSYFYAQPTIDLLLSICIWIETIQYSSYKIEEIVHLLPLPKQLANFSRHIRVDLSLSE